ncbi:MAG: hypothetical protein EAZ53_13665 [Bacteroidetes bacterium]|nr:MAG: hypothetical protein EAZ53_13665 [Bacteroidota bacterium]
MRINLSDFGIDFRSMRIQNTIKSNRDEIKKAFTYKYALFYDEGITFYQEVKKHLYICYSQTENFEIIKFLFIIENNLIIILDCRETSNTEKEEYIG